MANNEKIEALNRLKVVLVEKERPADGWQSSWAKLSIPFPDGARIKLNPLLHNYTKLQEC